MGLPASARKPGGQKYPSLGPADDALDADGLTALSFEQAQKKAQEWFQLVANGGTRSKRSAYTVADCIAKLLDFPGKCLSGLDGAAMMRLRLPVALTA